MPRANRYLVPGRTYHVRRRCHDRKFLFRFAVDRDAYRGMLRDRSERYGISILNYCITSNHTHLLVRASESEAAVSKFMQSLEGDFAQHYNLRKKRHGAFWNERYHATMIDGGDYLWRCLKYIDLNMVRAGVVSHPREWSWTGYQELVGERKRYRLIDRERLFELLGGRQEDEFRFNYARAIRDAVQCHEFTREARWGESLAVGSADFVREVGGQIRNRMEVEIIEESNRPGVWVVREATPAYA